MSHFTVMVIGPNVEKQLAPFHQFECTGTDDQYVQEIDETESYRKAYQDGKTTKYRDKEGKYHCPYGNEFYREPTEDEKKKVGIGSGYSDGISYSSRDWNDGKGYRPKVHYLPEGFTEVEAPYKELMSFADYCHDDGKGKVLFGSKPELVEGGGKAGRHKYGYTLVDKAGEVIKVVDRTNPNYKWDWYSVGGRWTGFFKAKPGAKGKTGRAGIMTEAPKPGYVDSIRKGDIDFEGMFAEAEKEYRERYRAMADVFGGTIPKLELRWRDVIKEESLTWEQRREKYHAQLALVQLEKYRRATFDDKEKSALRDQLVWANLEDYQCSEDEYAKVGRDQAISTFAVLKDGKWYEKGEMGWWGAVADEKDEAAWLSEFASLVKGLPDDTLLTVVDCHI